ncbi:MAG: FG-GAP-like repeat-containing protein [Cytophagales bacterium]|nr:FG-GAP-like repeat-containing protein [Cytophagales bacterium]
MSVSPTITGIEFLGNTKYAIADFNNDGLYDIVCQGNDISNESINRVYFNTGNNTFSQTGTPIPPLLNGAIATADIDQDTQADFIISGITGDLDIITRIYKNNGNGTFTVANPMVENLYRNLFLWIDYDMDGDKDLYISGISGSSNTIISKLYNNKGGIFTEAHAHGLPAVSYGNAVTADFNKDSYPDIAVMGILPNANYITDIYYGNGYGVFERQYFGFEALANGSLDVSDTDGDGYYDLALSGSKSNGTKHTLLYKNNFGLAFQPINAPFTGLDHVSLSWGNLDGDNLPDLAICGRISPSQYSTVIYKNIGNNTYSISGEVLENIAYGKVNWIDFDSDGDQELFVSGLAQAGPITHIYNNNLNYINHAPTVSGLSAKVEKDSVKLSWQYATDDNTTQGAITYHVLVSTSPSGVTILNPPSNTVTGFHRIYGQGAYFNTITGWIKKLAPAKYYWSVQGIDQYKKSGKFAPMDSFLICKPINLGNDTATCIHDTLALKFGKPGTRVDWYTQAKGLVMPNSFDYAHINDTTQNVWIWYRNEIGCLQSDSVHVTAYLLPVSTMTDTAKICHFEKYDIIHTTAHDTVMWYTAEKIFEINSLTISGYANENTTKYYTIISPRGCIIQDSIRIDTLPLPRIAVRDTFVCKGYGVKLSLPFPYQYKWLHDSTLLSDKDTLSIASITDSLWITINTLDNKGCKFADTALISYHPLPIAHAGRDTILCINDTHILGSTPSATLGSPPYSYFWSSDSILIIDSIIANPNLIFKKNSYIYLKVSDKYNCLAFDTSKITINPKVKIDTGKDRPICIYDSTQIGGSPSAQNSLFPYLYRWLPGDMAVANPTVHPTTTTTYTLIVSTYHCTADTGYVTVIVNPLPIPYFEKDTIYIGINETGTLKAYGGKYYQWHPTQYCVDADSQQTHVFPPETTDFIVTVTDSNTCVMSDTAKVFVKNQFFIPTLFSPNGDGNNDVFKIYGLGIKSISFKIYDIFGGEVFSSDDVFFLKNIGWDGKVGDLELPSGQYIWQFSGQTFDGMSLTYHGKNKGTINILR